MMKRICHCLCYIIGIFDMDHAIRVSDGFKISQLEIQKIFHDVGEFFDFRVAHARIY